MYDDPENRPVMQNATVHGLNDRPLTKKFAPFSCRATTHRPPTTSHTV